MLDKYSFGKMVIAIEDLYCLCNTQMKTGDIAMIIDVSTDCDRPHAVFPIKKEILFSF